MLTYESSASAAINEDADGKKGGASFILMAKADTTDIRATFTGAGDTGKIHWHCEFEQLSDEGRVTTFVPVV